MKERRFVLMGLVLMEFVAAVQTTGLTMLVPTLREYFNIPEAMAGWILMAYLLPFALALIPMGFLADRVGLERVLKIGIGGFAIVALLCVFAANMWFLILLMLLAGLCAGAMFATESAITVKYWGKPWPAVEHINAGLAAGVLIGPLFGALLAKPALWRYFFLLGSGLGFLSFFVIRKLALLKRVEKREVKVAGSWFEAISWGVCLNFLVSLMTQGLNLTITLRIQETLQKSAAVNAIILIAISAGILLANAANLGSRLFGKKNIDISCWGATAAFAMLICIGSRLDNLVF